MARRKRASMREGPLADLFRSTGRRRAAAEEEPPRSTPPRRRERGRRGASAVEERPTEVERPAEPERPSRTSTTSAPTEAMREPRSSARVPSEPPRARRDERLRARRAARDRPRAASQASACEHLRRRAGPRGPGRRPRRARHASRCRAVSERRPHAGDPRRRRRRRRRQRRQPDGRGRRSRASSSSPINTDLQSLQQSTADVTVHIGGEVTRGLGSGSDPKLGHQAAFEEQDRIKRLLKGSDMVFVTAGVGGGTGTGAAPVIARLARDGRGADGRHRHQAVRVRGHAAREAGRGRASRRSPTRSTR